jgi:hypothetical protein
MLDRLSPHTAPLLPIGSSYISKHKGQLTIFPAITVYENALAFHVCLKKVILRSCSANYLIVDAK